ncbi:MAG TPA: HAD-IA family hydrolase [Gammaproteobacteria bacterium]
MTQRFNLLVFDWDGTLMDSEAHIVACLRAAIEDLSLEPRDEASLKNIIGLGLAEAINTLYPGSDGSLHKAMTDRYRYHFLTASPSASELFSGAEETVSALAEAGYLLAVATGKGRAGLDKVLEETGMGRYFHATRCSDETFSKPHPLMLEQLMDELGAEPAETLMIGDTEYDMQMAGNARTAALAVSYGVHEKGRLLQHNPLHCIDAIDELASWLGELGIRAG